MRALTGELLLSAWDRGTAEHDIDRALTMLAFAMPETSREELAALLDDVSTRLRAANG